jgi:hypothetical protein
MGSNAQILPNGLRFEDNAKQRGKEMNPPLNKLIGYNEPKFGSIEWLSVQAGYERLKKLMDEDDNVRLAVKDLVAMSIKQSNPTGGSSS